MHHCTFTAVSGELTAIKGKSGMGKTTILLLLLGVLNPCSGNVTIQSHHGTNCCVSCATRQLFAYVPQNNVMFSGTVAENMRLLAPNATVDQIVKALKISCAYDFIFDLPQNINTAIGEGGANFSVGQCQRLAIARAILRDAPVLILDEATSALDTQTEYKLLQNIKNHLVNKTCIVTAHRPSVLKLCTRVYTIKDAHLFLSQTL